MERRGQFIDFNEAEQYAALLKASIPLEDAGEAFQKICNEKEMCGEKLQDMSITEAYDDQTALLLINARARLTTRHHRLERMTEQLLDIAGTEIVTSGLEGLRV